MWKWLYVCSQSWGFVCTLDRAPGRGEDWCCVVIDCERFSFPICRFIIFIEIQNWTEFSHSVTEETDKTLSSSPVSSFELNLKIVCIGCPLKANTGNDYWTQEQSSLCVTMFKRPHSMIKLIICWGPGDVKAAYAVPMTTRCNLLAFHDSNVHTLFQWQGLATDISTEI